MNMSDEFYSYFWTLLDDGYDEHEAYDIARHHYCELHNILENNDYFYRSYMFTQNAMRGIENEIEYCDRGY